MERCVSCRKIDDHQPGVLYHGILKSIINKNDVGHRSKIFNYDILGSYSCPVCNGCLWRRKVVIIIFYFIMLTFFLLCGGPYSGDTSIEILRSFTETLLISLICLLAISYFFPTVSLSNSTSRDIVAQKAIQKTMKGKKDAIDVYELDIAPFKEDKISKSKTFQGDSHSFFTRRQYQQLK